ncbi:MAG TPA: nuclease-related domain-containing protein [Acidimicrobiales bacterium]|nr:nuclease-related domain-containing protein [Acidimicrobiales bacterium]
MSGAVRQAGGRDASGESAEQEAAVSRARAANYRSRAERAESAAESWERGARAEVALAEVVAPRSADGYYQLDDRRFPGSEANVDHILVGPAGVFLIDSKVDKIRAQARQLAALLDEMYGPSRPEVRPAICFHGPARLGAPACLARVQLLDVDHVLGFVRDASRRCERPLDQAAVDEVVRGFLETARH